jgi:THO complex subunit 4
MLTYNQNGTSRGIASIIFLKPDTAAKAAKELNGLLVDGRPMKIEVVYDASHAPAAPVAKPLNERIAQKARPKSAAAPKAKKDNKNTTAEKGSRRGTRAAAGRGRNPGRGKPKTVEELDAEMVDYFNAPSEAAPVNGAAPQANANQDIGMNDEIS